MVNIELKAPLPFTRAILRPRPQGFTLIEILLVLAITGVILAVALPRFTTETFAFKRFLTDALFFLKQARMQATLQGRPVNVKLNARTHSLERDDGQYLQIPPGVRIEWPPDNPAEKTIDITFLPGGQTIGTRTIYVMRDKKTATISIDPISGFARQMEKQL